MLHISSKLAALITTIAVAAPISAAEAASSRQMAREHFRTASTQHHFRAATSRQSASSTATFHCYGVNWR